MRSYVSGSTVLLMMFIISVMLATAFPVAEDYAGVIRTRRVPRGFKDGAADRISHGFGKRSQTIEDVLLAADIDTPEYVVSDETLAEALTRSRRLSLQFVRTYVDLNDDGVITGDELLI